MENIYVEFEGMVYHQIVRFPMGTNCVPLIAALFLYRYERNFVYNLHKSKQYDLIDMLKIPLDILTIYSSLMTLNLRHMFRI